MDEKEGELHLNQYKDRTDLNVKHAEEWGKFIERKAEYAMRYGEAAAAQLLKKEELALVEKMNQDHKNLDQQNDQQWLAHFNNEPDTPAPKIEKQQERDMTDPAAEMLKKYRERQRSQEKDGHDR